MSGLSWMAWTFETAAFFAPIACLLVGMTIWELCVAGRRAPARRAGDRDHARRPAVHLAARRRLHPPRLARPARHAAVGRDGRDAHLRRRGVPLGVRVANGSASVATSGHGVTVSNQNPSTAWSDGEIHLDRHDRRQPVGNTNHMNSSRKWILGACSLPSRENRIIEV